MSVQGNRELRRATINGNVATTQQTDDFAEITASEDREILGLSFTTDQELRAVIGFSTQEIGDMLQAPTPSGTADVNASRSTIIQAIDDAGHVIYELEEPINWSAGEGLHVGVQNLDPDNSKLLWITVHYREV